MTRILVLANEHVNRKMAGPSIRCFELSQALSQIGHDVTLASPFPSDLSNPGFKIRAFDDDTLRSLVDAADVLLLQGWTMEKHPWLAQSRAKIVIDLYDPFSLEVLVLFDRLSEQKRIATYEASLRAINNQITRGDFFICASEKQRDFWIGWLAATNRVNPHTYADDASLHSLIDIVPFGIPAKPPVEQAHGIRGQIPGIGNQDFVMLWAGGIYNWFDPVTLVRATAEVARDHPNVRLVFMSTSHPNPEIQEMWTTKQARRVAAELGLTGQHVFFNDSWVEYEDRDKWLNDADVGVSTHFDHIETRYSFRTRILDYFWAGLPVLCTEGDTIADDIASLQLGITAPPEDVPSVAAAIKRLISDTDYRERCRLNVRDYAQSLVWTNAVEPLDRYCRDHRPAADRDSIVAVASFPEFPPRSASAKGGQRGLPHRFLRLIYQMLPRNLRAGKSVQSLKRYLSVMLDEK